LTNRRENGFHIGSFALYGYRKDPERKGHLIIDEESAQIVREVFTLFSQGYGKVAIARMLNDRGVPNPSEYKRLHGLRYQQPKTKAGTLWKYFAISDMLVNQIYIGNMVQGRYTSISYKTKINRPVPRDKWIIVEGTHEPIIDRELWDRVQEMIWQKTKPFTVGTVGLFANKVRCSECGYVMRSQKNHGKHYLQCSTKYTSKESCSGAFIPVSLLEKTVLSELRKLIQEYLDKENLESGIRFNDHMEERLKKAKGDLALYKRKFDECRNGMKSLYLDKVKGLITENEFVEFSKDFHKDRERFHRQIDTAQKQLDEINEKIQTAQDRRQLVEQYSEVRQLTRPMVETLIDCIYVGKCDPETKQRKIEIHWNF
jgi:hypothetical protein